MQHGFFRKLMALDLEEKILNGGSLLALVCVFFPWIGGEWLGGKTVTYSGLGFFTSFIGLTVLLLHLFVLCITLVPLTGGPAVVRTGSKEVVRLLACALAVILTVAVWSVLTKFTFEFSRLQIHFGLYGTLIGGMVATLYAFLRSQDARKSRIEGLFHHDPSHADFPAPPPPDTEPEDHRIHP